MSAKNKKKEQNICMEEKHALIVFSLPALIIRLIEWGGKDPWFYLPPPCLSFSFSFSLTSLSFHIYYSIHAPIKSHHRISSLQPKRLVGQPVRVSLVELYKQLVAIGLD